VSEAGVEETKLRVSSAIDEFSMRADSLARRLDPSEAVEVSRTSDAFTASSYALWDEIVSESPDYTAVKDDREHASTYNAMVEAIVSVRDDRVDSVLVASEAVGAAADAVRYLVIFVIPVSVMLVFKRATKKRRERETLESELVRQAHVIEAKDEFVANLSHELKTPLTSIYGFAIALEESGYDDQKMASEITSFIIDESAQLGRMVDDLITAGQLDSSGVTYQMNDVDVEDVIGQVVRQFGASDLVIDVETEGRVVCADRTRLAQILVNLLSNVEKHGGQTAVIATSVSGDTVVITITDDGEGIDPATVEALFSRYAHDGKTPLLSGSVGMGLAVAHSLAEGMGGSLAYQRVDRYTVFSLTLAAETITREKAVHNAIASSQAEIHPGGQGLHAIGRSTAYPSSSQVDHSESEALRATSGRITATGIKRLIR
jgi:signal transduction histidine kinase